MIFINEGVGINSVIIDTFRQFSSIGALIVKQFALKNNCFLISYSKLLGFASIETPPKIHYWLSAINSKKQDPLRSCFLVSYC